MATWLLLLLLPVLGATTSPDIQGEVNVYSHRHYATDKELFKRFSEKTGIEINVVKASADQGQAVTVKSTR